MEEAWEAYQKKLPRELPAKFRYSLETVFYTGALSALGQLTRDVANGIEGETALERAIKDVEDGIKLAIKRAKEALEESAKKWI